jgi:hypothetical protein
VTSAISRPAASRVSTPPFLYLVSSKEHAAEVRRAVDAVGLPPGQQPTVSVLETDGIDAAGAAAVARANGLVVFDLQAR